MKKTLNLQIGTVIREKGKRKNTVDFLNVQLGELDPKVFAYCIENNAKDQLMRGIKTLAKEKAEEKGAKYVDITGSLIFREVIEIDGKIYRGVDSDYTSLYKISMEDLPLLESYR